MNHDHEVHLCCHTEESGAPGVLPAPIKMMTNPFVRLRCSNTLERVVKATQPDVIHITVEPYALAIPHVPRTIAERTVLTVHGSYGVRPLLELSSRWAARRMYRSIARYIAVSNYTKDHVLSLLTTYDAQAAQQWNQRAHVIHNGIALPPWTPRKANDAVKDILLIGQVKPRKGVLEAIDACAQYQRTHGDPLRLTIVGSYQEKSSYVTAVRNRIRETNLTGNVELIGYVNEEHLEALYERTDLYLMPAITTPDTFEGFGLVYLEANARGIPCIGPNDSGAKEAIAEGVSGYRIDPSDPKAIAERMHWILDDKRIKPEDCRAWAEEHNAEKCRIAVEQVYALLHSAS